MKPFVRKLAPFDTPPTAAPPTNVAPFTGAPTIFPGTAKVPEKVEEPCRDRVT